ncbi:fibronectin type III domain-containing protein [Pontiellaceae bacterium B1224]|nr:fibronectin type III domain-containing protein [Pontiellaceae bacterium B1224]
MKSQSIAKIGAGVALALVAGSAQAAEINWRPSVDMYQGSPTSQDFVQTNDTLVLAISTAAGKSGTTNTLNGVPFVQLSGVEFNAGNTQNGVTIANDVALSDYSSFGAGSFTDADVGAVIGSSTYGHSTVTLTGLTIGQWYMIQLFSNDARNGRHSDYQIGLSDGVNTFATSQTGGTAGYCSLSNRDPSSLAGEASGDYIIGYFLADSTTLSIETVGSNNGFDSINSTGRAQINGFQLRALAEEPVIPADPPSAPGGLYATIGNMSVELNWSASTGDEPLTYILKRSPVGEANYTTLASGLTELTYTDTTVVDSETYDYVVSATNVNGESANSGSVTGVGFPYDIIGATSANGPTLDYDKVFDNDVDTFYDYNDTSAYAGVDYGEGNAKQIMALEYVLRNWNQSVSKAPGCVFEGANSSDFSDAVVLHTIPTSVSAWPTVNTATITNTTSFRYVRATGYGTQPNYMMAEIDFITEDDVTSNGTSTEWLDSYYDVSGANPSNFADYAAADVSDTDGDGLEAWEEYKLNGDPTDATSPVGVLNLYAWPEGVLENVVRWDSSPLADIATSGGYIVYRSLIDSNYTAVATVATNAYIDTDVTAGETYYYKASVTNATYEHETVLSAAEAAAAIEYQVIGSMINSNGAMKSRWYYELFDRNIDSFMDDNAVGGYAGLDYGVGNGQATAEVFFRLRADSFGTGGSFSILVDGVSNTVNRAQYFVYGNTFEGSNDGSTWTTLATITNMVPVHGIWNSVPVTDTTAYQYVRYYPANGERNFAMADVEFVTPTGYTAQGTPMFWLNENDLTVGDDQVDVDSDGHESWQEFLAYTDPNDSNSVLNISSYTDTNGLSVTWQSVAGVSYSVLSTDSLTFGTPDELATGITGLAGETTYTSTGAVFNASAEFFSIGVE